jgi:peroxiredoxin
LADYREHYEAIRSAGANVVAISVDGPEKSEALRVHLSLPFPILSDAERRVVRGWGIYNSKEKGGIAQTAVFVIDAGGVRFAARDDVMRRVPAADIVALLSAKGPEGRHFARRIILPLFSDWIGAARNVFER